MPNLPEEGAEFQFTHESFVQQINHCLEALPNSRVGKNTMYEMRDAALSAFSTFFMQSPSFRNEAWKRNRVLVISTRCLERIKFPVTIRYAT